MEGLSVDLDLVSTNIVFVDVTKKGMASQILAERLHNQGIRLLPIGPNRLRAVTNYHVTSLDIDFTLDIFLEVLKES